MVDRVEMDNNAYDLKVDQPQGFLPQTEEGLRLNPAVPEADSGLLIPTPSVNNIPFIRAGFATLTECLDYAAEGKTGINFYNGKRGALTDVLVYGEVKTRAVTVARKMQAFNLPRGSRVAIIADTTPEFVIFFLACQYAGLVPVPLPAVININGREAFIYQIRLLVQDCEARMAFASDKFVGYLAESCTDINLDFQGTYRNFDNLPEDSKPLQPIGPKEVAYIQYTSGSTHFPRGVMMRSDAALANLAGIAKYGLDVAPDDRCFSWLPFYHDMGLVGHMMTSLVNQASIDFLDTKKFAMRPCLWLKIMSQNKATISFSPPFGYDLCTRRLNGVEAGQYDLSRWRVAGVGAEMIRSSVLEKFAKALQPAGFRKEAFLPCYGMAESAVAITFSKLNTTFDIDTIDRENSASGGVAISKPDGGNIRAFVSCGFPLPEHEIHIRDSDNQSLPERHIGRVFISGPSVMSGYLNKPKLTDEVLCNGWLNTGDLGYLAEDGQLFIVGRSKDAIIINGRNIWTQDLEYVVETQTSVRTGDVLAFGLSGDEGDSEKAVVIIQTREKDLEKRQELMQSAHQSVYENFGIQCYVELVSPRTLPRTSSGKLSRSKARFNFLQDDAAEERARKGNTF